jgi:RNA polymerase sigma factor (TIGR02999 family)
MADEPDRPGRDVTDLLVSWAGGDRQALDDLIPLVYEELRRLAHRQLRGEQANGTIVTTVLVHEAYLRMVDQNRARLESRAHFLNVAAQMMRRVLVDAARKRNAGKRGRGAARVPLDDAPEPRVEPDGDLLDLDDALTRLETFDPHLSRVVELRYFGGLTLEETGAVLGVSTSVAWRDWNVARAWLFDTLNGQSEPIA